MDQYTAALFLPHTDLGRFPSVAAVLRAPGPQQPPTRRTTTPALRRPGCPRDRLLSVWTWSFPV